MKKKKKGPSLSDGTYGTGLSGILGESFQDVISDKEGGSEYPRIASLAEKNVDYLLGLVRVPFEALNNMQIATIAMQFASMFATMLRMWTREGKFECANVLEQIVRNEMRCSCYVTRNGAENLSGTIAWQVTIPHPDGCHHNSRRIGEKSMLLLLVDGRFVVLDFENEEDSLVLKKQRIAATPKDLFKIFAGRDPMIQRVLLTSFFPHIVEKFVSEVELKKRALDGFQSSLKSFNQKLDLTVRRE